MTLRWTLIDDPAARDSAWLEVARQCGYATYFQTPDWTNLMATALGTWAPSPIVLEYSDGNVAVLPMAKRLDSDHVESTFPGMYGGPLFLRPPTDEHWDELDRVPRWFSDAFMVDNPYAPFRWTPNGLVGWRLYTHRTDLSAGFDSLWPRFRTNLQRDYRRAASSDLTVRLATSVSDCSAYYDIYIEAARRFGDNLLSFYPRSVFEGLAALPGFGSDVQVWLACQGEQSISGLVLLRWGDIAIAWHYSTRPETLASGANPLLLVNAIREACADGLHWFDFLASGSLTGVAAFKAGFASERRPYQIYWSTGMTPDSHRDDAGPGAAAAARERLRTDGRPGVIEA